MADPLTNGTTVCNGSACWACQVCIGDVYTDYLFDVEADPREENNLIEVFPEVCMYDMVISCIAAFFLSCMMRSGQHAIVFQFSCHWLE